MRAKQFRFIGGAWLLITAAVVGASVLRAQGAAQGGVRVWMTTANKSALLAQQSPIAFQKAADGVPVIAVDEGDRKQTMDGFGFALTGGSAELLMKMEVSRRAGLLKELFGNPGDAALGDAISVSYLRVSIGSSDMNERVFTYDDLAAGESDAGLAKFDLGPDRKDVVPVLKEILALNPRIAILASPWSAPSWMKDNDAAKGGSLKPEFYSTYAAYLVKYLRAMAAEGIHIQAITVQNEPLNANNTPSMIVTAQEEGRFIQTALRPAFKKAGLFTDIILYDHNCDRPDYPLDILADAKTRAMVKGSGFHLYEGEVSAMTKVHEAHPEKDIYFTEQMVVDGKDKTTLDIARAVSEVMIGATRNWSRNVLLWNLAADPSFGPHTSDGGCPVCEGAITIDGDAVTRNLAYYTVAQVSKFVPPGSVRVGSGVVDGLADVAYSKPGRGMVLVVANTGKGPKAFAVRDGKREFNAVLDAGAVGTYVW